MRRIRSRPGYAPGNRLERGKRHQDGSEAETWSAMRRRSRPHATYRRGLGQFGDPAWLTVVLWTAGMGAGDRHGALAASVRGSFRRMGTPGCGAPRRPRMRSAHAFAAFEPHGHARAAIGGALVPTAHVRWPAICTINKARQWRRDLPILHRRGSLAVCAAAVPRGSRESFDGRP
jgi:hypothetical protein